MDFTTRDHTRRRLATSEPLAHGLYTTSNGLGKRASAIFSTALQLGLGSQSRDSLFSTCCEKAACIATCLDADWTQTPSLPFMNRRTAPHELLDLGVWPTITTQGLSPSIAAIVSRREKALRMYVAFEPLALITKVTKLGRQKILTLFKRAVSLHPDGQIQGFRACKYYARVNNTYSRRAKPPRPHSTTGYGGMFKRFILSHDDVADELKRFLLKGPRGGIKETRIGPKEFYKEFLEVCTRHGIDKSQYPFTTESKADRSVGRLFDQWLEEHHLAVAANQYGVHVARKLGTGTSDPKLAYRVYQRWEFDGHKIDGIFVIVRQLPDGRVSVETLRRIWLLAIRDCGSGAIVGHHIVLRTEYNSEDVLTCFENAVLPWKRRQLKISGLAYPEDGGLPSGCIPELAYAYPGEVTWDNAKANGQKIQSLVWTRIKKSLGCAINPGPVAAPDQRLIENFFRILARNGYQRIVSTTGAHPKDPRKRKDPAQQAVRYEVSADEIEELTDVLIADYNGTLSDFTPGHSPLERLAFMMSAGDDRFIQQVPDAERARFCLTYSVRDCSVCGPVEKGHRPHINLLGAVYSSPKLSAATSLLKKKLKIRVWTRDVRTVTAYYPDGTEFGPLIAQGGWGVTAHDIRVRRAILKLRRRRKLVIAARADPIKAYHRYLAGKLRKNRRAANDLAHSLRIAAKGQVKAVSPGLAISGTSKPKRIKPRLPYTMEPRFVFKTITF